MTHDSKLIEAMARAMACHFSMNRMPHMSGDPLNRLGSQERRRLDDATDAALTALCAARPDVAAVLAGEAVALPKAPTDAQWDHIAAVLDAHPASLLMERQRRWWPDLVAASPYAREPKA